MEQIFVLRVCVCQEAPLCWCQGIRGIFRKGNRVSAWGSESDVVALRFGERGGGLQLWQLCARGLRAKGSVSVLVWLEVGTRKCGVDGRCGVLRVGMVKMWRALVCGVR